MYGKVMSVSDELMWRFYELLTDLKTDEIEALKRAVAVGSRHPMQVKHDLAKRIVTDFHSAEAAQVAQDNWIKQFSKKEVPTDVPEVAIAKGDVQNANGAIKLDKLLVHCGMAESASDGQRKIKQNAVKIDGSVVNTPTLDRGIPFSALLQCGRHIARVQVS